MPASNFRKPSTICLATAWLAVGLLVQATPAGAADAQVDDFSDPRVNSLGIERLFVTDASAGGRTVLDATVENGVLAARGEILPPRGQPGWASTALLFDAEGNAMDASDFEGIRLRVRIHAGNLSITANSTEVTNFDYHGALVTRQNGEDFHEVRIPFSSMKRAWSEQTPLDPATLASISIVAFDMQPGAFDYEIDEVGFY